MIQHRGNNRRYGIRTVYATVTAIAGGQTASDTAYNSPAEAFSDLL